MKIMKNYLKAEFQAQSINEGVARMIVAGFVMPLDPTLEAMADVKTAVSEAVTNSIIHGYEGSEGIVSMELWTEDRLLTVRIHDDGIGIDNVEKAREPLYTSKPDEDRSGMGFTVMESFMDTLHIESEKGKGTTIIMTKKL
jgi:stage II sporulation protein AB (anti-sigma F factor)